MHWEVNAQAGSGHSEQVEQLRRRGGELPREPPLISRKKSLIVKLR